MALPSITIKIDFGSESVGGSTSNISLQGNAPAPNLLSVSESAAFGQSQGSMPTPFDGVGQGMYAVHDQPPTPFDNIDPGVTSISDQPPAPFDNIDPGMATFSDQPPAPLFDPQAHLELTAEAPIPEMHPAKDAGKEGKPASDKKKKK